VPASAGAPLIVIGANEVTKERLQRHDAAIKWRARVETITLADDTPKGSAQFVIGEATACLPLGSLIDVNAEIARLTKEAGKIADESDKISKKLGNEKFVANAKPEIVEAERERMRELQVAAEKIEIAIRRVREAG
jgi:valyl-tRNA synthetase